MSQIIDPWNEKKYSTLVTIIDKLKSEAPSQYKKYHPLESDLEKVNQARARAFIHLFLKVKFGLLDFVEREEYITDDPYDGGIDAYYIDQNRKLIYFIQSKYRTNNSNFNNKEIMLSEILNMDIGRITRGEITDENGNKYNNKILTLIDKIGEIDGIARYDYEVIILANLNKVSDEQLKKLTGGFPCRVFDYKKCYDELVFPVVSGTYYNEPDLYINIDLTNKHLSHSRINYPVKTEYIECDISILFVPTIEIAKVLHKYRNSILKFNPRNFLELSRNPVNQEIERTIKEKDTNDFSLFNNGITILSDETSINENVGKKNKGQLHLKNPQIVNGGQTAFTLCRIYEDCLENGDSTDVFNSKEVLLKIITFSDIDQTNEGMLLKLIEEVSKATNQQTAVNESDRRSNDKIQVELQKVIYDTYGYFYERKRGEFHDGFKNGYIDRTKIINRDILLRAYYALSGSPAQARRASEKDLFKKQLFDVILNDIDNSNKMFFAFLCFKRLNEIEKPFNKQPNNRYGILNYGYALRYGKMAVITASYLHLNEDILPSNIEQLVEVSINETLLKWTSFEEFAKNQQYNRDYFRRTTDDNGEIVFETNFDGYYKGKTLNNDIKKFFIGKADLAHNEAASGHAVD